jgi:hypothetical protein
MLPTSGCPEDPIIMPPGNEVIQCATYEAQHSFVGTSNGIIQPVLIKFATSGLKRSISREKMLESGLKCGLDADNSDTLQPTALDV